jgi:hypothetical protein
MKQLVIDKVLLFNTAAITLSFMNIEYMLKILLLSLSIAYTIVRLYKETKKSDDN